MRKQKPDMFLCVASGQVASRQHWLEEIKRTNLLVTSDAKARRAFKEELENQSFYAVRLVEGKWEPWFLHVFQVC